VNAAITSALGLIACGVAALAFELENEATLHASLIVGAMCSVFTVRNLYTYARNLKGSR
jgi:hypothetical protein